jgi:hypothetical protein
MTTNYRRQHLPKSRLGFALGMIFYVVPISLIGKGSAVLAVARGFLKALSDTVLRR